MNIDKEAKFYYANARLGGKTVLLAGPFANINEAEAAIEVTGAALIVEDPKAEAATFGVMSVNNAAGLGRYNRHVGMTPPSELIQ